MGKWSVVLRDGFPECLLWGSPTLLPGNPHPYPINKPNSPVSRVDSYFGLSLNGPYEDGGDIVYIPPGEEFL